MSEREPDELVLKKSRQPRGPGMLSRWALWAGGSALFLTGGVLGIGVSRDYFQPAAPHQVTVEEQWSCPARPAQPCVSGLTMTVDPTAGESTEEQEDSLVHGLSNMLEAPHPSPAASPSTSP
jgi:hypothetical protein